MLPLQLQWAACLQWGQPDSTRVPVWLLHWLALHWGDVVPTWLAAILAAVFGIQAWRASRRDGGGR